MHLGSLEKKKKLRTKAKRERKGLVRKRCVDGTRFLFFFVCVLRMYCMYIHTPCLILCDYDLSFISTHKFRFHAYFESSIVERGMGLNIKQPIM